MDDFKRYNELLDSMIEHVKNNNGENQILDYNTRDVREIRINIKKTHMYMNENLDKLSKDDIQMILEKIIKIEDTLLSRHE
ncbi:hypothetical protein M4K87_13420 [Staphylococcus equorum]|uniref:hypothetical protein n=1 Tax=Staphylococcus equorum TaxID=246432 RepID=UPI002407E3C1|nr:hypothetical protein [Staphylococcus equorum]MDG0826441.1 hypothetical protein [Staphylococcus equorum]